MEKKFELTDKFVITASGVKLFQIRCTRKIKYAEVGDLGGYVEKEENLSHDGNAWVSGDACVFGNAWVSGDACVFGDACVSGDACVFGNARVYGNAWVSGDACVFSNAWVSGDAKVEDNNNHCGFDCFGSANRHTHAYLTKDGTVEITCGCFRGSIEQFEKQVERTHGDSKYGREYKAIIEVIKIKFGIENREGL